MKERPILFSAPMVRALLAGTKTQTRRPLKTKFQIADVAPAEGEDNGRLWYGAKQVPLKEPGDLFPFRCRLGQPGDRLWVRENGWERPERSARDMREGADTWPPYEYDAEPVSTVTAEDMKAWAWKRRPSIHMPRWASRITLEVVAVRVERLQDITEADAIAEGSKEPSLMPIVQACWSERDVYAKLWESINGSGSWDANPWVWVVEFKRVTA